MSKSWALWPVVESGSSGTARLRQISRRLLFSAFLVLVAAVLVQGVESLNGNEGGLEACARFVRQLIQLEVWLSQTHVTAGFFLTTSILATVTLLRNTALIEDKFQRHMREGVKLSEAELNEVRRLCRASVRICRGIQRIAFGGVVVGILVAGLKIVLSVSPSETATFGIILAWTLPLSPWCLEFLFRGLYPLSGRDREYDPALAGVMHKTGQLYWFSSDSCRFTLSERFGLMTYVLLCRHGVVDCLADFE